MKYQIRIQTIHLFRRERLYVETNNTLTEMKAAIYATMADALVDKADMDAALMDSDPTCWQQIRDLDDWLVLYRKDDRVGLEQYKKNCDRMLDCYNVEVF